MKVKLICCTHDMHSEASEIIEVPDDTSKEELEAMAEEFFWNEKEPEWWYKVLDNNSEDDE